MNDPGALQVEFDFFSYYNAGSGHDGSTITIHGVPLTDILQTQQFAGANPGDGMGVLVKGGMTAGLPLNDPKQVGTILSGKIFQSWANWVGTEMNLNFVVFPSNYTFTKPGNFVVTWKKNTSLADALRATLAVAYPNLNVVIRMANTYVNSDDRHHVVSTLQQLAKWATNATQTPINISTPINDTITISDGTVLTSDEPGGKAKLLKFTDLIGQPAWTAPREMQFTTVMRGDIQVGDIVQMPQGLQSSPGLVQTTVASNPTYLKYKTAFQGNFLITTVRQVGNFRDPQGSSWATVFNCNPLNFGNG